MSYSPYRPVSLAAPLLPIAVAALAASVLLLGLLAGSAQWLMLAGVLVLGVMLAIFLVTLQGFEDRRGWLLAGGWCAMLLSPGVNFLSDFPVGYVLEIVVFGLALAAVRGWRDLAARDGAVRVLLLLLLLYYLLVVASSVLGRSHWLAALWQLQYSLKWPLMFGLGMLLVWNGRVDNLMRIVIAWSWLFILPALVLEIVQPAIHSQIFGPNVDNALNPFFGTGTRHRGPFIHPGSLAMISALLTVGATVQLLAGRGGMWGLLAVLYFAILLPSGQRQELFALVITLFLLAGIHWRRHIYLFLIVAGLAGGLAVAGLIYFEHVPMRTTLVQWGLIDSAATFSERAILTTKGIEVAQQFFPLGSGLGTYGGPGAQKHDLSLFIDLGFGRYWWFRQGKFLVDTYWPCIVAESGFLGALLLLAFFVVMWSTLLLRALRAGGTPNFALSLLALGATTLLLGNSPSAQTLTDPRGAIVFWLIIGAGWRATVPASSESRRRRGTSVLTKGGLAGTGIGMVSAG